MFVQTSRSRRNGKTYVSHLVRESHRTAKGPRARTVANITGLPEIARQAVADALKGIQKVPLDALRLESVSGYGGVAVLCDAWERFRMDEALGSIEGKSERALLKAAVLGQLLFNDVLPTFSVQPLDSCLPAACGLPDRVGEQAARHALDRLHEHWERIEAHLAGEEGAEIVVLYELRRSADRAPSNSASRSAQAAPLILCTGFSRSGIPVRVRLAAPANAVPIDPSVFLEALREANSTRQPLLFFQEDLAGRLSSKHLQKVPFAAKLASHAPIELALKNKPAALRAALNREGVADILIRGKRYVLASAAIGTKGEDVAANGEQAIPQKLPAGGLDLFQTNVPSQSLPAAELIRRSESLSLVRRLFSPLAERLRSQKGTAAQPAWLFAETRVRFLACTLAARLQSEWREAGESAPVIELLREIQTISLAKLSVKGGAVLRLTTPIPDRLAAMVARLNLLRLFESHPAWTAQI